jgi:hypothetical protein
VRDIIEQTFDVELYNPVILPASLTRDANCIQRRFTRSVAVGVLQEYGIEIRLNDLFDDHLRDSIAHSGNTQDPFAPTLLGNGDSANRRRKVASRAHPVPDPVEVTLQVGFERLDRLPVHTGSALAGLDRFICIVHSPLIDHKRLVCRIRRRHPVSSWFKRYDHLIRPLRSSPITAPSSLLRVSPPQLPASVLSPCGGVPLVLLPWHQQAGSCSSTQKPASDSRPLYAGHCPSNHQAPDGLVPEEIPASGFSDDNELSRRVIDGFAFARLSDAHLPQIMSGTFDPTLTTTTLYRSSSDWFETCS